MIPNITWGSDFNGLIKYLIEHRDHQVLDLQGVSSVHMAAAEMAAVASLSNRAKNSLLHLSLSAAHEDGTLTAQTWMQAADRMERALCLSGHQRVVVRHQDKTHDHVHIFWCTVSVETGRTPPKHWFLKKGNAVDGIGPNALNEAQIASVAAGARALRTYDFRALARAQALCRQLERALGLRQLRTPEQAAAARIAGEGRPMSAGQNKREERLGVTPLTSRAEQIREALDSPDWPSRHRAIDALGLDFEPLFRATKKGTELRGLMVFDPTDPANRVKASAYDTSTRKYGLGGLEARLERGADRFDDWWARREPLSRTLAPEKKLDRLKGDFDLLKARHIFNERQKAAQRTELRSRKKRERRAKERALMKDRKANALLVPSSERRAFYRKYSEEVRAPAMAELNEQHRVEAMPFARTRVATWSEYLAEKAAAGDREAAERLEVLRPSKRRDSVEETGSKSKAPSLENTTSAEGYEQYRDAYQSQLKKLQAAATQEVGKLSDQLEGFLALLLARGGQGMDALVAHTRQQFAAAQQGMMSAILASVENFKSQDLSLGQWTAAGRPSAPKMESVCSPGLIFARAPSSTSMGLFAPGGRQPKQNWKAHRNSAGELIFAELDAVILVIGNTVHDVEAALARGHKKWGAMQVSGRTDFIQDCIEVANRRGFELIDQDGLLLVASAPESEEGRMFSVMEQFVLKRGEQEI